MSLFCSGAGCRVWEMWALQVIESEGVGEIPAKWAGRSWCSELGGCGEVGKPGTQDAVAHRLSLLSGFAQPGFLNRGRG